MTLNPGVAKIEFQNQMNLNEFGNKNKYVTAVWFHSGRRLDDKVIKIHTVPAVTGSGELDCVTDYGEC